MKKRKVTFQMTSSLSSMFFLPKLLNMWWTRERDREKTKARTRLNHNQNLKHISGRFQIILRTQLQLPYFKISHYLVYISFIHDKPVMAISHYKNTWRLINLWSKAWPCVMTVRAQLLRERQIIRPDTWCVF